MRIIKLEPNDDGSYTAVYEWSTCRFLLEDGSTVDIRTAHDDSTLRTAVLALTKSRRIEGVAYLKAPEPDVPAKPTKKVPAKKVGQQRAGVA